MISASTSKACGQWRDQIMTRLQSEHPKLIMLSMSRRYGADFGTAERCPVIGALAERALVRG
jgi:hypothetical protein